MILIHRFQLCYSETYENAKIFQPGELGDKFGSEGFVPEICKDCRIFARLLAKLDLYYTLLEIAYFQASGGSCRVGTAHHQRGHVARQGSQPFTPN